MTLDDMAALHALSFSVPAPWSAASMAATLADPAVFVLTEAGAFLIGRSVADEAELLTLAVAPQARRSGIAVRLVMQFLDQARLRGAQQVFLEVAESNLPARALYARCGFAEAGRRKAYYRGQSGQSDDGLILRRPLAKGPEPDAT